MVQCGENMETVGLEFELPDELAETVEKRHSEGDLLLSIPGEGE